jgi:hypothetical protein
MYAPRRWRRVGSRAVVAGTEKSGDLNRFLLLLFFVFFFLMAVMGVSYYLQTKENLKH